MKNKLAGFLFILFGTSLLGDSLAEVFQNSIGMDRESVKSVFGLLLGISSSIYGYKRMKMEDAPKKD